MNPRATADATHFGACRDCGTAIPGRVPGKGGSAPKRCAACQAARRKAMIAERKKAGRRKGRPQSPMDRMAAALGGKCHICEAPYETRLGRRKGYAIHHVWYARDEKTYLDFKSVPEYHAYLEPIVASRPDSGSFALLCMKHHYAVESGCRWEPHNFARYAMLVKMSHRPAPPEWCSDRAKA